VRRERKSNAETKRKREHAEPEARKDARKKPGSEGDIASTAQDHAQT